MASLLVLPGCFGHRLKPPAGSAKRPPRREVPVDASLSIKVKEREGLIGSPDLLRPRLAAAVREANLFREVRDDLEGDAALSVSAVWTREGDRWAWLKKTFYFLPLSYNHTFKVTYFVEAAAAGELRSYSGFFNQVFSFRTFSWWRSGRAKRAAADQAAAAIVKLLAEDLDAILAAAPKSAVRPSAPLPPRPKPVPTAANDDQLR